MLGVVRKSQEMTLDAIKQVVETVNAAAESCRHASPASCRPCTTLPGAPALPTPETVVSATFDFLDRLLAEQRKFAGELVKATARCARPPSRDGGRVGTAAGTPSARRPARKHRAPARGRAPAPPGAGPATPPAHYSLHNAGREKG